MSDRRMHKFKI